MHFAIEMQKLDQKISRLQVVTIDLECINLIRFVKCYLLQVILLCYLGLHYWDLGSQLHIVSRFNFSIFLFQSYALLIRNHLDSKLVIRKHQRSHTFDDFTNTKSTVVYDLQHPFRPHWNVWLPWNLMFLLIRYFPIQL